MSHAPPNPFRSRSRRVLRLIVPLVLLTIVGLRYFFAEPQQPNRFDVEPISAQAYQVDRVVDGDTLIVLIDQPPGSQPRRERVRLLGIDAPETVKENHPVEPWGPEAAKFTRQFVADNLVRLEFDQRRVDQYGRHLAYVYVGEQMLNEALVAEGLARASFYDGDNASMRRRFQKAEQAAQEAGRGIWSESNDLAPGSL